MSRHRAEENDPRRGGRNKWTDSVSFIGRRGSQQDNGGGTNRRRSSMRRCSQNAGMFRRYSSASTQSFSPDDRNPSPPLPIRQVGGEGSTPRLDFPRRRCSISAANHVLEQLNAESVARAGALSAYSSKDCGDSFNRNSTPERMRPDAENALGHAPRRADNADGQQMAHLMKAYGYAGETHGGGRPDNGSPPSLGTRTGQHSASASGAIVRLPPSHCVLAQANTTSLSHTASVDACAPSPSPFSSAAQGSHSYDGAAVTPPMLRPTATREDNVGGGAQRKVVVQVSDEQATTNGASKSRKERLREERALKKDERRPSLASAEMIRRSPSLTTSYEAQPLAAVLSTELPPPGSFSRGHTQESSESANPVHALLDGMHRWLTPGKQPSSTGDEHAA